MNEQIKESEKFSKLFDGLTFFLYTEVTKQSLEFVILSFGGNVMWAHDTRNS